MTVGGRQWQDAGSRGQTPRVPPRRRGGRVIAPLLLVVGAALMALALLAGWAQWQLLDADAWDGTSERLLERDEVRDLVAGYVVGEVRGAAGGALPPGVGDGLESRVAGALDEPRPERAWRAATAEAHAELVEVIEDDSGGGGDTVTLDLRRLIGVVAVETGLPFAVVPDGIGEVTIVAGRQARGTREAAGQLDRTATALLIAAPLVLLLAVFAATGWRLRALAAAGIAIAAAGAIVLITRAVVGAHVVDVLTPARSDRDAVGAVWSTGTTTLAYTGAGAIIVGLLIALAAGLAGGRRREQHP